MHCSRGVRRVESRALEAGGALEVGGDYHGHLSLRPTFEVNSCSKVGVVVSILLVDALVAGRAFIAVCSVRRVVLA
jgi:hypothetical protein